MLQFFQFIFSILIILIIVPQTQTPTENFLLIKFHESGFFSNYSEAKSFLIFFTWFCIVIFLILTFL